jgi:nucleoside 2-deoxyribosyltransferase
MFVTTKRPVCFLALPITRCLGDDGLFRKDRRDFYQSLIAALQASNCSVVSPALNEDWGRIKLPVEEFTQFDVDSIRMADVLLVATDDVNRDISLEIGLAIGAKILVVLLVPEGTRTTFMIQGLRSLRNILIFEYADENHAAETLSRIDFPDLLSQRMRQHG